MSTLHRVSYIDRKAMLTHEWFPTLFTANDRVNELDTLGMESIDFEEVEVPWDHLADLIHWLNNTPNSPNLKDDTMPLNPPFIGFAEGVAGPDTFGVAIGHNGYISGAVSAAGVSPLAGVSPPASALDRQEGGSHYKDLKIQPVEYIHANSIPFVEGCVIKYVSRWRSKGGVKDLEKARHFIDLLIELESRAGEAP